MSLKVSLIAENSASGNLYSTDVGTYLLAFTEGLFVCTRDSEDRLGPFNKVEAALLDGFRISACAAGSIALDGVIEGTVADVLNELLMDTDFCRKIESHIQLAISRNWKEFSKRLSPRASATLEAQHPDLDVSVKHEKGSLAVRISQGKIA